ncbi:unnamed protein product, partial [Phaeothamnion confervicola]
DSYLQRRILESGGRIVAEYIFLDAYFDFPGEPLLRRNCWLRKRAGLWELKVPMSEQMALAADAAGRAAVYRELTAATEITAWLLTKEGVLPSGAFAANREKGSEEALSVDDIVAAAGGSTFAEYRTTRRRYALPGERLSVDIDSASYGHVVVEVEAMCAGAGGVDAARAAVAAAAAALGLQAGGAVRGKLEEYVWRYRPDLVAPMLAIGMLK